MEFAVPVLQCRDKGAVIRTRSGDPLTAEPAAGRGDARRREMQAEELAENSPREGLVQPGEVGAPWRKS